jgi:beta-lactamase regulating signal transducer with metallopeptidase domain
VSDEMESVMNITITTSVTALIVFAIKTLLKNKISPKWQCILWLVLALRLVVPVFPQSNVSVFNAVPQVKNIEVSNKTIESTVPEATFHVTENMVKGDKSKAFSIGQSMINNVLSIWIAGSIIMFIYMASIYFIYNQKLKRLKTVEDLDIISVLNDCKRELDINAAIKVRIGGETPLLKGIFRPEIILPDGYTKQELKSVFIHELMHYKHKDVLWNIVSTLLLCAYWYNPIMWFSFSQFRKDMEIQCDYRVLEVHNNKREYASVLLKTALKKNNFLLGTTSMQNGEKHISKRIKYIAYFKKPKVLWSIIAIITAILTAAICLTNPITKASDRRNELDYERIYQYKTLYVGDASKVSNLANSLHYAEYKKGISLDTDSRPYGITVNYQIDLGDISIRPNNEIEVTVEMLKNAAIMFCLIDNVDTINFNFDDGSGIYSFPFTRQSFNSILGTDIREYSTSINKFKDEFIPLIMAKDWASLKLPAINKSEGSSDNIGSKVEKSLGIIMSSPKESSNPNDYIKAHQKEYENILKMGDEALQYMLSSFNSEMNKGLRSHIMMSLCIDLLGERNNVKAGSYTSPEEWYSKLSPNKAEKLPEFKYQTEDKIEAMVYSAALNKYTRVKNGDSVTIVAPHIFGTYEKGIELKIFATVYYNEFKLYDKAFSGVSGGIVPAAIVYTKNNDGSYAFEKYVEAMDGSEFKKSIERFCKPRNDIAEAIMKHYGNYEDLSQIMRDNLRNYAEQNNMKDMNLKENDGEVVPLT